VTRTQSIRLLLAIAALGLLVLAYWSIRAHGERLLTRFLASTEIQFNVPDQPIPLLADVAVHTEHVTICNRGKNEWTNLIIRVTDRFGGNPSYDAPYFAQLKAVSPGGCADIAYSDFRSAGWKEIPAPAALNVVRVEILASVTGLGYFVKDGSSPGAR